MSRVTPHEFSIPNAPVNRRRNLQYRRVSVRRELHLYLRSSEHVEAVRAHELVGDRVMSPWIALAAKPITSDNGHYVN